MGGRQGRAWAEALTGAATTLGVTRASMRHALAAGIGVHFLPCFDGDADPDLVRLGARLQQSGQDLWVLTLPDLRHNRRIRAFMDHAYEAFAAHRDAMAGETAPG